MSVIRHNLPGGEWLYYKLYTQPVNADAILIELLPIVQRLRREKMVDLFFFIRYNDPLFHLRLRFRSTDPASAADILTPALHALFEKQVVYNITIDTYHREIERYGADTILAAEQIFGIDSLFIINAIGLFSTKGILETEERWLFSLPMIDSTLDSFGLLAEQKLVFVKALSEAYKAEYTFTTHRYVQQIDVKYRLYTEKIRQYLAKEIDNALAMILASRCEHLQRICNRTLIDSGHLPNYAASIIHMSMNRWFKTQGRLYELFLYSFLVKYYTTEMMRNRNGAHHYINH